MTVVNIQPQSNTVLASLHSK